MVSEAFCGSIHGWWGRVTRHPECAANPGVIFALPQTVEDGAGLEDRGCGARSPPMSQFVPSNGLRGRTLDGRRRLQGSAQTSWGKRQLAFVVARCTDRLRPQTVRRRAAVQAKGTLAPSSQSKHIARRVKGLSSFPAWSLTSTQTTHSTNAQPTSPTPAMFHAASIPSVFGPSASRCHLSAWTLVAASRWST